MLEEMFRADHEVLVTSQDGKKRGGDPYAAPVHGDVGETFNSVVDASVAEVLQVVDDGPITGSRVVAAARDAPAMGSTQAACTVPHGVVPRLRAPSLTEKPG
jgi:hypothetical protein